MRLSFSMRSRRSRRNSGSNTTPIVAPCHAGCPRRVACGNNSGLNSSTAHMAERNKTHNGRDVDGHYRVKQADVDDLLEDPAGADFVRDDVKLGGAIEDVGPHAGERGEHIEEVIRENA